MIFATLLLTSCAQPAPQEIPGVARDLQQESAPAAPGRDRFPDWDERDHEGRWALYAKDAATDADASRRWQGFLTEEHEHVLLEWIVLTELTGWKQAGAVLAEQDAPQWIRAAVWALDSAESHSSTGAATRLRQSRGRFLGWLRRFPSANHGGAAALAQELVDKGIVPEPYAGHLPPYDPRELFGALSKAAQAVPFGARLGAEPGDVYEHQVERAIAALATTRTRPPEILEDLFACVRDGRPRLARKAALAFSSLASAEVPGDELHALSRDDRLDPTVRAAAFLAASYAHPARAYVRLHDVVGESGHPQRVAALSRLGELGDAFTLTWLEALEETELSHEERTACTRAREQLRARENARRNQPAPGAEQLRAQMRLQLERLALAQIWSSAIAEGLGPFTKTSLTTRGGADAVQALRELSRTYEPEGAEGAEGEGAEREELRARVRGLAAGYL